MTDFSWITLFCCSERSGSNLTRSILSTHRQTITPNATGYSHQCNRMMQLGRIDKKTWRGGLLECLRILNSFPHEFDRSFSIEELVKEIEPGDFQSLLLFPYRRSLDNQKDKGARLIVKEHQAWRLIPFFQKVFPKSKVILQTRHIGGFYQSCKKLRGLAPCYFGSPRSAIDRWHEDKLKANEMLAENPSIEGLCYSYETLVETPERTATIFFNFIGLTLPKNWSEFQRKNKELLLQNPDIALMWQNLDKPIDSEIPGRWRESLAPWETLFINRHTWTTINELGNSSFKQRISLCTMLFLYDLRLLALNIGIYVLWVIRTKNIKVKRKLIFGKTIRSNRPYELFRERILYRLS